jgi:histone H3/H4
MARSKQTANRSAAAAAAAAPKKKSKPAARVADVAKKAKKPHRWRSGTVAGKEIKKFQKRIEPIFQRAPFIRLIKGTLGALTLSAPEVKVNDKLMLRGTIWRLTQGAVDAAQSLIESQLVATFDNSNVLAHYAGRVTVDHGDVWWAKRMASGANSHVEEVLYVPPPKGLGLEE